MELKCKNAYISDKYKIESGSIFDLKNRVLLKGYFGGDLQNGEFVYQIDTGKTDMFYISINMKYNGSSPVDRHVLREYERVGNELVRTNEFDLSLPYFGSVFIPGGAFLVGKDDSNICIYSPYCKKKSRPLFRISSNEKNKNGIVIVQERIYKNLENVGMNSIVYESTIPKSERFVDDIITYGLDLKTMRIATKIYSRNQDRFIDLYTNEDILRAYHATDDSLKAITYPKRDAIFIEDEKELIDSLDSEEVDVRGELTIFYSIKYPLLKLLDDTFSQKNSEKDIDKDKEFIRILRSERGKKNEKNRN